MKKLLAILLALMLVLANVAALAEGGAEDNGMPSTPGAANDVIENGNDDAAANASGYEYDIKKTYNTTGTATNVYPTETLQFTVTPEEATYPTVTVGSNNTFTTDGTQTQTIPVNVPAVSAYPGAGRYHYTVTEIDPEKPSQSAAYNTNNTTFNVDVYVYYPENSTTLVREAVIYSGDAASADIPSSAKTDTFTNTYSVGSLQVSKAITGNLADPNKVFTIVITLNATNTVNNDITIVNNATSIEGDDAGKIAKGWTGTKTITMTAVGGQSIKLDNIPTGVTYTVAETGIDKIDPDNAANQMAQVNNANAYGVTGEVTTATAIGTTAASETVTNNKTIEVPTGIVLDSIPYVLIMSMAVIALVVLKARKREEF